MRGGRRGRGVGAPASLLGRAQLLELQQKCWQMPWYQRIDVFPPDNKWQIFDLETSKDLDWSKDLFCRLGVRKLFLQHIEQLPNSTKRHTEILTPRLYFIWRIIEWTENLYVGRTRLLKYNNGVVGKIIIMASSRKTIDGYD